MQQKLFSWHETRGQPITAYGRQVTPIGHAIQLRGRRGSFTWQRPLAVEIRENEMTRRLPLLDTTGQTITALTLLGLIVALILLQLQRANKA